MRTIPLGKTGVEVSALCLGTIYFGAREDRAASFRLLDLYAEAGGAFFDTANIYSFWLPGCAGGECELLLGDWLRERRNRARVFIASKVGFGYPGVERGLRPEQIEAECDKSLKRLGVDCIDLYYAHVDDPDTPVGETMAAFDRLVKAGKTRFIGASNFAAWRMEEARGASLARGWAEYACVQQRHTYLRPKPGASFSPQMAANADLADWCAARGATLLAYSPLLNGAYTRPDRPVPAQYAGPDTDARLAALKAVAAEAGATPNQVVLAWMLRAAPPVIPVFAASTPEQMRENIGALEVELSDAHMARLDEASA
jgi:aryl-alcohol dehydrogenase-like predicted oxidoreductase